MSWILIFGMAMITFLNRFAFFAQSISYRPGEKVRKFLSFSSYAILTSIWAPILFGYSVERGVSIAGLDYLLAALVAAILSFLRVTSIVVVLSSTTLFFALRVGLGL